MSRTTSSRTPTATTSPSCSTRTRSDQALRSSPSPRPPQAKTHEEWLLLLFVDCCDALRSRSAQSTFTTKLPRNATHQSPRWVTFFQTRSSWLLAMLSCGAIGGLDESCKDRTGFLNVPNRAHARKVDAHGCCAFDIADLGFCTSRPDCAPFLSSFISASPTSRAPTASRAVLKHSNLAWSVGCDASDLHDRLRTSGHATQV